MRRIVQHIDYFALRLDYKALLATLVMLLLGGSHSVLAQSVPDPDLNNDGIVDTLELSLVASCFGLVPSQVPRCACTDVCGNDLIDEIDYNFVL